LRKKTAMLAQLRQNHSVRRVCLQGASCPGKMTLARTCALPMMQRTPDATSGILGKSMSAGTQGLPSGYAKSVITVEALHFPLVLLIQMIEMTTRKTGTIPTFIIYLTRPHSPGIWRRASEGVIIY